MTNTYSETELENGATTRWIVRGYVLRSLNNSKADADDATLIERVELAASYPIAFPKGMSGITRRRARYTIRSVTIQ